MQNPMRVEPFPLKVKVDAQSFRMQGLSEKRYHVCKHHAFRTHASTLTLRGKGSTRIEFVIMGWHLFSQTPVSENRAEKKEATVAKNARTIEKHINSSRQAPELLG